MSLTDKLIPQNRLTKADPFNADEMAPHKAAMIELLTAAFNAPEDYYYAVVVIGKDGLDPLIHGTARGGLLAAAASLFIDPMQAMAMDCFDRAGLTTEQILRELATVERPEFAPTAADYDLSDEDYADAGSDMLTIDADFAHITGIEDGGDVAGPQPAPEVETNALYDNLVAAGFVEIESPIPGATAWTVPAAPIDVAARTHVEGDLNGDGVVDEKDEALRLAQLADDGNPHVND